MDGTQLIHYQSMLCIDYKPKAIVFTVFCLLCLTALLEHKLLNL